MEPSESTSPAPATPVSTAPAATDVAELYGQLNRMLRAVVVLALLLATAQALELWQCWRSRDAAHAAGQLRHNIQYLATTLDEFRRIAANHPDLIAISRKYGLEPVVATPGSTATNRPPARP